jgi:hypothetical protein
MAETESVNLKEGSISFRTSETRRGPNVYPGCRA